MDAHDQFDHANALMEELDQRFKASGEARFADYLRKNPEERASFKDISRIREEANDQLIKELGE